MGNSSSLIILFFDILSIFSSLRFSSPLMTSIKFSSKFNFINFVKFDILSICFILLNDKFNNVKNLVLSKLSIKDI